MKKQIILQTTQYSLLKMEFTSLQLVNSITKKTT
ncbi:unnamed protein product [Paramecium sonneborni]|uniref:Uncharacterized protein n=1 Tax=Paramecium sonneborni TaxID=65129 RepID=A0A8S1RQR3_9CILI|nr:unnamed protein product [Paramecium sonneborni]